VATFERYFLGHKIDIRLKEIAKLREERDKQEEKIKRTKPMID
jgi:hypothetical protein